MKKLLFIAWFISLKAPVFSQINLNLGVKNFNEERYKEAIYWLDKAIASGTEDTYRSLSIRGISKSKLGDFKGAEEDLFGALQLNPRDHKSYYNLALVFIEKKECKLAINYLDTAMTLTVPSEFIHNMKALAYSCLNDYPKAIEEGQKAVALAPEKYENNLNMGRIYLDSKHYEEALKYFNKALSIIPKDVQALHNRSKCFEKTGDYVNAIADIDSILIRKPGLLNPLIRKGEIRYKQKKFNEACNNFDDVKKLNDSLGTVYITKYCDNRDVINYFPDGKIEQKCTYKNGLKNGPYTMWHANGKLLLQSMYTDGKLNGKYTTYFENGNTDKTGDTKNDEQEGAWTHYYESGKLKAVGYMTSGFDNGAFISYYENGKVHIQGTIQMGRKEGVFIENYESGTLKMEYTYKNGIEHGDYKVYYPNGKLQQQGTYVYGKEYDAPKKWDEKGVPVEN